MTPNLTANRDVSVVVVGGGFAGIVSAKHLAKHDVPVTLIDRHDYNQFQPLLYQVATAQVETSDVARPLRTMFSKRHPVQVKMADITDIDPVEKTVTSADGVVFSGDYLVLAVGAEPNFFDTPGADTHAFPLYSVDDAERLRSRLLTILEDVNRDPRLIDQGALNFVIVGAGATGVETAGALADAINRLIPARMAGEQIQKAQVIVVDPAPVVLAPFSDRVHEYAKRCAREARCSARARHEGDRGSPRSGVSVRWARDPDTQCRVGGRDQGGWLWRLEATCPAPRAGGWRSDPTSPSPGFPACTRSAMSPTRSRPTASRFPNWGRSRSKPGAVPPTNILAEIEGKERQPFRYRDKGIMAMIGRNAAVAEVGARRRELHGVARVRCHGSGCTRGCSTACGRDCRRSGPGPGTTSPTTRASAYINRPDATQIDWDE